MKHDKRTIADISFIWAMGKNGVVGKDNKMPWRLPAEMAYFRQVTTGHTVIMGRRTYESIGGPLKNRTNVIMTRDREWSADGCVIVHSVDEVLSRYAGETIIVIGGAQIYEQFMPYVRKLYVTVIDHEFEGDTYFPEMDWSKWKLESETPVMKDERNPYSFNFKVYEAI